MLPSKGREYIYDAALDTIAKNQLVAVARLKGSTHQARFFIKIILESNYLSEYIEPQDAEEIFEHFMHGPAYFIEHSDEFADSYFEISPQFDDLVSERENNSSTPLAKTTIHGAGWMRSALKRIFNNETSEQLTASDIPTIANTTIPEVFSDEAWSPIPLERTGEKYESAVTETQKAYEEIKASNGYSQSEPEERDAVVWSLGEGLKQIKEGLPTKDQVVSMLVKPFKYISEKFAGAAIGEAAKVAVKALIDWITS